MESPERSECISAPVDQGSPFFKYLCGLSPIKPTRSVHVVQTYAELSLPPPPAVFTSPANPHKCGGRSKRGLVVSRTASTHVTVEAVGIMGNKWGGDKENHPNQAYIPKSYFAGQVDARHPSSHASSEYSRQHSCPKSEQEQGTGSRVDTPTKFECGDVSDYLADPPEGGLYTTASSSQLVPKSYVHRLSPSSEENGYHKDDHQNEITPSEASSLDGAHCDDPANITQRNFNTIQVSDLTCHQISDLVKTDTRESLVFRSSGSSSDHEGSGNCGNEKLSCVDQETAAMAFLLVGDADCDGATRNDWGASHSAIAELSTQQTPDFSAIGRLSNEAQLKAREDIEVATSKALENPTNAETDKELEDRKDVLVVGTGGQRGVRRRCLDFETSVRRKSSGGGSSRKSLVLKPKNLPVSSAMTSVSSIPPSILCERAVATSDATNSAVAASRALDSHSHMSSRPECTSSFSRVLSPGLLRISRCSVQGNTDLVPTDQCSTDPTRAGSDCNNHSSSVGIPSGIGLHLNSLTGSISFSPTNRDFKQAMGITSTTKGAVASLLGMPGLIGTSSDNLSDEFGKSTVGLEARSNSFSMAPATSNFGTGVVISVMERSRVTLRKSLPVTDVTPGAPRTNTLESLAVGARQSLEGSRSSRGTGIDKKVVSGGKKRLVPQDVLQQTNVDYADEYDSPRSQKKRRKSPTASGEKSGEGCKRCNCKKSKCLKLYCECFAAGTYCVGSCTCHDCFNKPEHEDTVLNTRHQIESRNPLAFAPKIVHSGDASPKRGEEIIETPVSARHKRGCNCKKSLCLKKYCECYQAGVGCSEGCRCEGCKNMYGRKEAVEDSDDKETASDAVESGSMEDELEISRIGFHAGVGNVDQQRNNSKDLSPITPSFLYGQGRTTGRVRSAGKKRSASPLSNSHSMAKLPRSPGCATRSSVKFQSNNNAQQTPHMQGSRGVNSPISTPKLSRVNQLSPRWDGLGDICTLTPLPHPPLRPTPASLSTLDRTGASPCFSCQSIEPISSYQPEKLDSVTKSSPLASQRASDHSPLSSFESRNPLISGDYPMSCAAGLSSSAYAGSDNLKAGDARSSFLCDDSDTPDFLKYTDTMNSPLITKSGSPKQKRVSPPHVEGMRDRNRDGRVVFDSPARSSPGLRSGRKFILQALPSLPPVKALTNSSQNQISSSPQV